MYCIIPSWKKAKIQGQCLLIRGYPKCMAAHNIQKRINEIHHHVNLVEAKSQMMNSVSAEKSHEI